MSIFPWRASVPATSASIAAASLTSTDATSALPPAAVISSTVAAAFRSRAAATTVAPCAASFAAIARPMPRDAPVTSATRPDRSIISFTVTRTAYRLPIAGDQRRFRCGKAGLVLHAEDSHTPVNLLDETRQHGSG